MTFSVQLIQSTVPLHLLQCSSTAVWQAHTMQDQAAMFESLHSFMRSIINQPVNNIAAISYSDTQFLCAQMCGLHRCCPDSTETTMLAGLQPRRPSPSNEIQSCHDADFTYLLAVLVPQLEQFSHNLNSSMTSSVGTVHDEV